MPPEQRWSGRRHAVIADNGCFLQVTVTAEDNQAFFSDGATG